MPIAKQLRQARSRSPLAVPPTTTRRPPLVRPLEHEPALPCLPQQAAWWRTIAGGICRTTTEIVARFTTYAGTTFPNFLLAVLSFAISEFLAGCAAYGQALYCTPIALDDRQELHDPEPAPPFSGYRTRKPALVLISERAPGLEWHPPSESKAAFPHQGAQARIAELTRPAQMQGAPSRWYRAIVVPVMAMLSNIHEAKARRQAVMELNAFDDRELRDIGLSRGDIQAVVRRKGVERCDRGPQR